MCRYVGVLWDYEGGVVEESRCDEGPQVVIAEGIAWDEAEELFSY